MNGGKIYTMGYDSSKNDSNSSFGAEISNNSLSGCLGVEALNNSSSSGFGVENPSGDYNSNYKGVVVSEITLESAGNVFNIGIGDKEGIAGGAVYLGKVNRFFVNDSIEDMCNTSEVSNVQSWLERGSIFGSVIKVVTDLYNKYLSSEIKSVGNAVNDIDHRILAKIEEVSSGGWDSPFRNIQLDGCIKGDMAESVEKNVFYLSRDCNEIQLDSSAGDILSTSDKTDHSIKD
jgi:hypothetical protein